MNGKPIPLDEALEAIRRIAANNQRKAVTCPTCGHVSYVRKAAQWINCQSKLCMKLIEVRP